MPDILLQCSLDDFVNKNSNSKFCKTSNLISKLNFDYFVEERGRKTKWEVKQIARLYLFKILKGFSHHNKLIDYLIDNPEESHHLGFYYDEGILVLPPKRSFNHLLSSLGKKQIQLLGNLAEKILSEATKNNIILDLEIVKRAVKEKLSKKSKVSVGEIREAVRLVKKLVYPRLSDDLKIKPNGKFTTKDLLDVLIHVALTGDFTNNGSNTFRYLNEEKKCPSPDVIFYHLGKIHSMDKITKIFEKIQDVIFNFAKRNYSVLNKRKLEIAYDIHDVPFYGKGSRYVCGGKNKDGTTKFFKFLTCSIVSKGERFILDIVPISPLCNEYDEFEKSLLRVKSKIRIECIYLDRGFDRPKYINAIKRQGEKFLMPKIKSLTVKAWLEKSEGCSSRVIEDFRIGTETKVNLILVNNDEGVKQGFICNFKITHHIATHLYTLYSRRWGIETSYRSLEYAFKIRTTTKNYNIRLFHFLFSCCLFNLWVLVNICVSLKFYGRLSKKPIITAKMFALILYRVKMLVSDPGG